MVSELRQKQQMRRRIQLILMRLNKDEIDDAFIAVNNIFMKSPAYQVFQDQLETSRNQNEACD